MIERYLTYLSTVRRYSSRTIDIYRAVLEEFSAFASVDASPGKGSARQNFALRAHPSQPDGWAPPVHETTGGHGCQQQPALADKQEAEFNNYCEDAIEFLRKTEEGKYDLMIVDPPAFAKHRGALKNALRAYQRLNAAAIAKVAPGGLVFTFSCSQVVDKITFANTVFSAAAQTGRSVRILDRLCQGADHPVSIYHPEGEYLKGLLLYVE
jgi:Predicted SAM-dependent methyltransferases